MSRIFQPYHQVLNLPLKTNKNLCVVTQTVCKVFSRKISFTSQELLPLSNCILDLGDIQLEAAKKGSSFLSNIMEKKNQNNSTKKCSWAPKCVYVAQLLLRFLAYFCLVLSDILPKFSLPVSGDGTSHGLDPCPVLCCGGQESSG